MGTYGARDLERGEWGRPTASLLPVRDGLANRPGLHLSHQPLRSVRATPGLALPARDSLYAASVPDSGLVPHCPPSFVCRVVSRILVSPTDDRRTSSLCHRHYSLHSSRDPIRGTRSHSIPCRICGLSPSRAHDLAIGPSEWGRRCHRAAKGGDRNGDLAALR